MINNGFTPDKEDYEFCAKVDNMVIPGEGFFGISAATGGLAGSIVLNGICTNKQFLHLGLCSDVMKYCLSYLFIFFCFSFR